MAEKAEAFFTDAMVFLANVLAGGPRLMKEVEEEAGANLIRWRTLRRAKDELRVTSVQRGRRLDLDAAARSTRRARAGLVACGHCQINVPVT